eukprot:4224271-Prymnesium_polylepis.1
MSSANCPANRGFGMMLMAVALGDGAAGFAGALRHACRELLRRRISSSCARGPVRPRQRARIRLHGIMAQYIVKLIFDAPRPSAARDDRRGDGEPTQPADSDGENYTFCRSLGTRVATGRTRS